MSHPALSTAARVLRVRFLRMIGEAPLEDVGNGEPPKIAGQHAKYAAAGKR